ncbi:homocysteine S-methyltransferase family protein [Sphingomicrobium astaxanthinifaciens]|uniref:homocysteine S-methyltransferase family protein n=1 Tax=Sphingomicrobium astaxanthinifaciens TaxID=1227949 RepID=UPI001FCC1461|nr:homocysteine S-methyltransferase family protein [Sphingomicrobium astaxanthinifaciens]MCJ7422129.1 homocysteine S-methyltransferase family protein [Sphingomicrobium astaxanthinifaciens]
MYLPQLEAPFLTDGGLETDFLYNHGYALPHFSAITLIDGGHRENALLDYYRGFLDLAETHGVGFLLESPTWRASPDWAAPLGLSLEALAERNHRAIRLLDELRIEQDRAIPIVLSGCLGPRGDGYRADAPTSAREAAAYHRWQIDIFAEEQVDLVSGITITTVAEAVGIAEAARAAGLPCVISFTVETDGRLPEGTALGEAIAAVDAQTRAGPAYYMVNCAHPDHFARTLDPGAPWIGRLRGLRCNASRRSHAELEAATELDAGDPDELAASHARLVERFADLHVLGGCCGTDLRHVRAIAEACYP